MVRMADMGDSDDRGNKQQKAQPPAWQQAASNPPEASDSTAVLRVDDLDVAKQFLDDEQVRDASRAEKAEFLKSKGIAEADIQKLLDESDQQKQQTTSPSPSTTDASRQEFLPSSASLTESFVQENKSDHPPIVTYPEFLTKPTKPPPLITASGLLNSLGVIAGLSSLVYGATKYIVSPMVGTLTEARIDFHENANKNLSQLVEKLEHTVSEIPATYHTSSIHKNNKLAEIDKDDDASSYDDPTELFHRDVGVQTSPPASPVQLPYNAYNSNNSNTSQHLSPAETTQYQTDRLARISVSVRSLTSEMISQAEDFAETKNVLDKFSGDLHTLTYPPESFGGGSNYLYGSTRSEPDDEIKRAKMNIRSVKGVLLSTRSFPATTR